MGLQIKNDELFAIGDIHGCANELKLLLNELPLTSKSKIIFLGDYIDRGPNSKEVIQTIIDLKQKVEVVTLVGNHEQMLLSFFDTPEAELAGMFIYNGGGSTLASYSEEGSDYQIPNEHMEFFRNLRVAHQEQGYYFVHAGLPLKEINSINFENDLDEMLWIREPFLSSDFDWGQKVVHGHTPVGHVDIRQNRINLDTGCVFNRRLSAMGFPSCRVYSVKRQKKVEPIYLKELDSGRIAVRFQGKIPVFAFKDNRTFEFETLDYNEFGVFIRDLSGENFEHFKKDEKIQGIIGSHGYNQASFSGSVVRVARRENGVHYAVQMDSAIQVEAQ